MTSNDEILEYLTEIKLLMEETNTVVKSMVDLLVVGKKLPSIDYDHEREIGQLNVIEEEDLQAVHDETKPDVKLYVEFMRESPKAVMFKRSDDMIVWVPKSQMRDSWESGDHLPLKEVPSWCNWKKDTFGGS